MMDEPLDPALTTEPQLCPCGYVLRKREWGTKANCKDDCRDCEIARRHVIKVKGDDE